MQCKCFSQLSYENKGCSECQQDVRKTGQKTDWQIERNKDYSLFSLVVKTKVVQNVNRMSERQAKRQTFQLSHQNKTCSKCQQVVRKLKIQTDMTGQLKSPLLFKMRYRSLMHPVWWSGQGASGTLFQTIIPWFRMSQPDIFVGQDRTGRFLPVRYDSYEWLKNRHDALYLNPTK